MSNEGEKAGHTDVSFKIPLGKGRRKEWGDAAWEAVLEGNQIKGGFNRA